MTTWNLKKLYKRLFVVGDGKTHKQKSLLFIYSIFFGLLIAFVFVSFFQTNPFSSLFDGIKATFSDKNKISLAASRIVILGLAGMAVGVGFKTGIFNIGVSGQMIMGGITAGIVALNLGSQVPNGAGQILVIFIALLAGSLFAGFAGVLKAYFNIHEVVSTILLNWIAFFLMKWMLDPNTSDLLGETMQTSKNIHTNYLLRIDGEPLWPIIAIMIGVGFLLWIFIYKSKYGMIFQMTSFNANASRSAGVNTKLIIIASMMISGAIAGLLGAVLYFGVQNNFLVPTANVIPIEGFNGIAISIISYSHPLLTIIVAFLFGVIQQGIVYTSGNISVNFIPLVLGVLMYVSAISNLFIKLKWGRWLRGLLYDKERNNLYYEYKQKRIKLDENYYNQYRFLSIKSQKWATSKRYFITWFQVKKKFYLAFKKEKDIKLKQSLLEKHKSKLKDLKKRYLKLVWQWQNIMIEEHSKELQNLKNNYLLRKNQIITIKKGIK